MWNIINRVGTATQLEVDDGDGQFYNASLGVEDTGGLLKLHRQEGVHIGGVPEYYAGNVLKVHKDYSQG